MLPPGVTWKRGDSGLTGGGRCMAQYAWTTCPEPVRGQIDAFVSDLNGLLKQNLCGVYLHGSLAMGCFNPERSDIDLLVVTHESMHAATKRGLGELLLHRSEAPRPIEISFLSQHDLHPWQYPTPFELHYSEEWRLLYERLFLSGGWEEWSRAERRDPDLAAHITITCARGICLRGRSIREVFPDVPRADYVASILSDVAQAPSLIAGNPVYTVLNLCRVRWYLQEAVISSKDEAGAWSERTLPLPFAGIVTKALRIYRGANMDSAFDSQQLADFASYMLAEIHTSLHFGSAASA